MLWRLRAGMTSVLLLTLLTGCQQEWHLAITALDGTTPRFCVTKQPACTGDGVWVSIFDVFEVTDTQTFKSGESVWWIEPAEKGAILREFVYGVTPPGYRQVVPPKSLRPGRIYQVGLYWFRLKEEGGKLSYEVARMGQLK